MDIIDAFAAFAELAQQTGHDILAAKAQTLQGEYLKLSEQLLEKEGEILQKTKEIGDLKAKLAAKAKRPSSPLKKAS